MNNVQKNIPELIGRNLGKMQKKKKLGFLQIEKTCEKELTVRLVLP